MKPRSIVLRSALSSAIACSLVCTILFAVYFKYQKTTLEDRLITDVKETISKSTSFILGFFFTQGNWIHLEEHQKKLNSTPNTLYSYIVGPDGKIEVGINGLQSPDIGFRNEPWEPNEAFHSENVEEIEFNVDAELAKRYPGRLKKGQKLVLFSIPIIRPSIGDACGYIRVAVVFESIQETLSSLLFALLLVGSGITLGTGLVVFFLTKRQLRPLRRISEHMRELATQGPMMIEKGGSTVAEDFINYEWQEPAPPNEPLETKFFRESLTKLTSTFQQASKMSSELHLSRSVTKMAVQVAHDIRSPLTALSLCTDDIQHLPEAQRVLIRSAVSRISDIANQLLDHHATRQSRNLDSDDKNIVNENAPPVLSIELISGLVESIVSEKRIQYRQNLGITIEFELNHSAYGLFCNVSSFEFKRVLSNLINNSVEAIGESEGYVKVVVSSQANSALIEIKDNGIGIPRDILEAFDTNSFSYKKPEGNGIGLMHAKNAVRSWGGSLKLSSENGTTVTLSIPLHESPIWFLPNLPLSEGTTLIVVDDDASIHHVWQSRFEKLKISKGGIAIRHFSGPTEVLAWLSTAPSDMDLVFLVDYEFMNEELNGIGLIEKIGRRYPSVLVTSRFEDKNIVEYCTRNHLKLLPKSVAAHVPLFLIPTVASDLTVLIDDDPLVGMTWNLHAEKRVVPLKVFSSADQFIAQMDRIPRSAKIFIDRNLGDGVKGEDVAKVIYDYGFQTISLVTGEDQIDVSEFPWLSGVFDKRPPWISA
mgnify:CR=1 FL=1